MGCYPCLLFAFKKKKLKKKKDVLLLFPELGSTFRGTQTKTTDILSYTISKIRLSSADNSVCQTAQEKKKRQTMELQQLIRPPDFLLSTFSSIASSPDVLLNCTLKPYLNPVDCTAMPLVHSSFDSRRQVQSTLFPRESSGLERSLSG